MQCSCMPWLIVTKVFAERLASMGYICYHPQETKEQVGEGAGDAEDNSGEGATRRKTMHRAGM